MKFSKVFRKADQSEDLDRAKSWGSKQVRQSMEQKEGQFDWRVENKEENHMSFKTETLEPKIQGKTFTFNIKY